MNQFLERMDFSTTQIYARNVAVY